MKNKKLYIIIPLSIAFLVFVGVFYYYNREDDYSLNAMDKKWIQDNIDTVVDIEYVSDYPVYGGENGVFKSFIKTIKNATNIDFNEMPYLKNAKTSGNSFRFRVLSNDNKLGKTDKLVGEDVYVAFAKERIKITDVTDFKDMSIGAFAADAPEISYYLRSGDSLSYKTYDTAAEMIKALENGDIKMAILPNIMYLNETIGKKFFINYTLTEMNKKIVFTTTNKNDRFDSIMLKLFNYWKNNQYVKKYNSELLNYYIDGRNISDKDRTSLLSKSYVYGYVENYPYEVRDGKRVIGISGEYINRVNRLTGIDFKYSRFTKVENLEKAVQKGEVDIFFNYYDISAPNYNQADSSFIEQYVVLSKNKNSYVINSFEALKDKNINMIKGTALFNYFKDNSKANIVEFEDYKTMLKRSSENLLIIDREVYLAYRSGKFASYDVLYNGTISKDYNFMIKNEEANFYDIFNYITNTNSYYSYRNVAINDLNATIFEKATFEQMYILILLIIFVPLIILIVSLAMYRRKKKIKVVKKEERRKYTDLLTSLKNRNYLNLNIDVWNKSRKYPQAVIVLDLNNVKYVNDNYGHEEGDRLIIKAAATLVNTQLENSEIIRTDGNEFLVYLVGYSEKQVEIYTKKLIKEFKNLPYKFGAAIGYSMIFDDIKTVDDAINEATIQMRINKGEYK